MGSRNSLDLLRVAASRNYKERDYWLSRLSGEPERAFFPYDYVNTHENNPDHLSASVDFNISGELFSQLMRLSSNYDYTLYMVLVAGLAVLLDRYTFEGSGDIILGAPIYKQETKGEFINSVLVLRNRLTPQMTFKELLLQVKQTVTEANENQNYPIELLSEHLHLPPSRGIIQLFEIVVLLESIHDREYLKHRPLNILLVFQKETNFIKGKLEYRADLYRESTIERIANHYLHVLENALPDLGIPLRDIDILSVEGRDAILFTFNRTESDCPYEKSLTQLFAEQAEKVPDRVALVGEFLNFKGDEGHLSYKELNKMSLQLAGLLRDRYIRGNNIVGIMTYRAVEMVIGVLGILEAGGAYLPLEPSYPRNRVDYILADSGVEIVLKGNFEASETGESITSRDSSDMPGIHVLNLDRLNVECDSSFEGHISTFKPSNLAYVIYTSGSTGKPKGVMVEHRSAINVLAALFQKYPLGGRDTYLLKTAFIFDVSVSELFGWYWGGGRLSILTRGGEKDPQQLVSAIQKWDVTHINFVPSMFQAFVDWITVEETNRIHSLKYVFLAGEALSPWIIRKFKEINSGVQLENIYGPTEGTIYASQYPLAAWDGIGPIPIGKPLPNVNLYIVDRNNKLLPVGVPGELIIAGLGVARGYLNHPELTAEKFLFYSYKSFGGTVHDKANAYTKLYKTGDLTRWQPDGNIEFLGRIDHQVKIRGFRVELGEIENRLLSSPQVKETVVIVKTGSPGHSRNKVNSLESIPKEDLYLCAYIVTGQGFTLAAIKEHLGKELPAYMIPAVFVQIDKIPLTPSGKVDRKSLPEPAINAGEGIFITPRDEMEMRLAGIWSAVLGIEADKISIDSNFFAIGGHSLKATAVISKVHREFNVRLNMTEVFKIPTLRAMAECIKQTVEDRHLSIVPVEKKEFYPLSPAQSRLYILQQVNPEAVGYNMPVALLLEGRIHVDGIQEAFKKLIQRHETLRTSFEMVEDEPVQRVHDHVPFAIEYDTSATTRCEAGEGNGHYSGVVEHFIRSFDLSRAPLLRVGFIKVEAEKHVLMVDLHHIAVDGTSLDLIVNQFISIYLGEELLPLPIQYKDFSVWKAGDRQVETVKQQKMYWLSQFEGQLPVLNLPADFSRPAVQGFEGSRVHFEIGPKETERLTQLALQEGSTLYMALLAVITVFLAKLSEEEDVVIGTPVAGRRHVDLEAIVGMFANTLALRNYPTREKTFISFLKEVKERTLDAYDNQDYPFEELVDSLELHRDASRNPVFDVLFVLQNMEQSLAREIPGVRFSPFPLENSTAKFDMQFNGIERKETLLFTLEYSTALFRETTIIRLIEQFKQLLGEIINDPGKKLAEVEIVTPAEKEEILAFSRGHREPIDGRETIHGWFERIAHNCSDKLALTFGDRGLAYRELDKRAGRLAAYLANKGVSPGTVVALMAERSIEMVIGILAILKAGGAYLPIDIDYPDTRKKYLLEDSGVKLVLTVFPGENAYEINNPGDRICDGIEMIDIRDKGLYGGDEAPLETRGNGGSLLYLIYTSGSTGNPKGVMMEHRALVNLLRFQLEHTCIPFRRVLQFITISFDVSFQEIFSTLTAGGTLYLIDKETRSDILALFKVIEANRIETLFLPASFLKFVLNEEEYTNVMPRTVKHIITAGEQLVVTISFRRYMQKNRVWLHNHYGPAETHVVTTLTIDPEGEIPELPYIGKPVSNTGIYILDRARHWQPIGVTGELYISGIQVCRGYWRSEAMTMERFMDNPFVQGERLYKTGDLARWLGDGNIEFLGRADHQIKIRGFRVEPGEIESHLLQIEGIKEAVVIAHQFPQRSNSSPGITAPARENYLCAYVVSEETVDMIQLRNHLSQSLPDYMIPAYFIRLGLIPLTPNKKVDRDKLPVPSIEATGEHYVAPRDKIEKQLVSIWTAVLKLPEKTSIGIDDDFFELGGHSLKATVLMARIQKQLKVKITLGDIFKYPTIRSLRRYINELGIEPGLIILPVEKKVYYPLSSAQQRLFILNQTMTPNIVYNLPLVLILEGALDIVRCEGVFKEILNRHDSLRTAFILIQGKPVQVIHEHVPFKIEYDEKNRSTDIMEKITQFIRPFDLSEAPLLRVGLIKEEQEKFILLFDMHHIISDGVSMEILRREFIKLYEGKYLPPLSLQYKDFAIWQNRMLMSEEIRKQEIYWLGRFNDGVPQLKLPADFSRSAATWSIGDSIPFSLNEELTRRIRQRLKETGVTLYMMLLAIYNVLLSKYSGQEDLVVGLPMAGRNHSGLHDIIGFFINTLVIRNAPHYNKTFREFLMKVKQNTLDAFENQDYPFDYLVSRLNIPRNPARNPIFDAMFVLQNLDFEEHFAALTIKPYNYGQKSSHFDLHLQAFDNPETINLSLEYSTGLFKRSTVEIFSNHFIEIANQAAANLDIALKDIHIPHHFLYAKSSCFSEDEEDFNF